MKVEPLVYGDRKVYTVAAFNRGIAQWLTRLPTIWVEGEVTELRRQAAWQTVFFSLNEQRQGVLVESGPTTTIFTNPEDQRTEDYITGRFG